VRGITWALIGCLIPFSTLASDKSGTYAVRGSGTVSCGTWTQEHRERSGAYYEQAGWLAGYISAVNAYAYPGKDIAEGVDVDGIEGWVDNYCSAHPLDSLATAARALVVELRTRHKTP